MITTQDRINLSADPLSRIPERDRADSRAALSFFELTREIRASDRNMSLTDAMDVARQHDLAGFLAVGRLLEKHPDLAVRFYGLDDIISALGGRENHHQEHQENAA